MPGFDRIRKKKRNFCVILQLSACVLMDLYIGEFCNFIPKYVCVCVRKSELMKCKGSNYVLVKVVNRLYILYYNNPDLKLKLCLFHSTQVSQAQDDGAQGKDGEQNRDTQEQGSREQTQEPESMELTQEQGDTLTTARTGTQIETEANAKHRTSATHTVDSWGFDWLRYEANNKVVTKVWCCTCREYYSKHQGSIPLHAGQERLCNTEPYISGTTNIKKDTANTHGKSKSHIAAFQALTTPSPEVSDTVQCLQRLNDRTKEKMCKLFDIAYTVVHSEQPFTLFRTLVGLEKKHGVELGVTYQNSKACRLFIEHIAGTMKDQLHDLVKKKPFYCSLLFDGSTDKTTTEKEVISIKVIENGTPRIRLLG